LLPRQQKLFKHEKLLQRQQKLFKTKSCPNVRKNLPKTKSCSKVGKILLQTKVAPTPDKIVPKQQKKQVAKLLQSRTKVYNLEYTTAIVSIVTNV
jgi:hypothetical protein